MTPLLSPLHSEYSLALSSEEPVYILKMNKGEGPQSGKEHSRKPKYTKFTQQELHACKPIVTPGKVIAAFTFLGILLVPIGLTSLFASDDVVEIQYRYDKSCNAPSYACPDCKSSQTNQTCSANLIVPKKMKSPIFVYYQLNNFYQNHRRYTRSRSVDQLRSHKREHDVKSTGHAASYDCDPIAFVPNTGAPIVPCGLVAWSLFNDTYEFSVNNNPLQVNKKDIAWKSDKETKFGSDVFPANFQSNGLIGGAKLDSKKPLNEQEDLMVWMRLAAFPNFRKLYGRIEVDLEANDNISVTLGNNYNSYSFKGQKWIVLSTTTWIGGRNNSLGIAYLTVGGLCFLLAVVFIILHLLKPREIGDPNYLSWNKARAANEKSPVYN